MKIDMNEISKEGSVTIVLRTPSNDDEQCEIHISGCGNGWIDIIHGCHSSTIYTAEIKRLARGAEVSRDVPRVHGDEEE